MNLDGKTFLCYKKRFAEFNLKKLNDNRLYSIR